MIPEVTVTLSVPADRLAELGAFCLETGATPAPAPTPDSAPTPEPEPEPEKPKKPRRARRTKAQVETAEPSAVEETPPVEEPAVDAPSEDDVRAAVKAAVIDGKLSAVNEAFTLVGVECVSDVAEKDRATVIASINGKL